MRPSKREVELRVERFTETCRHSGVRLTHQRLEVFRAVARSGEHPDAETVHRSVQIRMPRVSLDTVYRTLWLLNDLGLITTLGPSRERTRFDANLSRHHHFVCAQCGMTRDFHCKTLDNLKLPPSAKSFGRIDTTLVEVRGICRECEEKRAKVQKPEEQ